MGVRDGVYNRVLDLTLATTYTAAFINNFAGGVLANAEPALISGFNNKMAYFNIHTTLFPGGEIRGFLNRVPEPGSLALAGIALAGLVASRRRAPALSRL